MCCPPQCISQYPLHKSERRKHHHPKEEESTTTTKEGLREQHQPKGGWWCFPIFLWAGAALPLLPLGRAGFSSSSSHGMVGKMEQRLGNRVQLLCPVPRSAVRLLEPRQEAASQLAIGGKSTVARSLLREVSRFNQAGTLAWFRSPSGATEQRDPVKAGSLGARSMRSLTKAMACNRPGQFSKSIV